MSRPLRFGETTKKVGISIPEALVKRAREEELNISSFVTRCLRARYNHGELTIDDYSGSFHTNPTDRWDILYESWEEYNQYLQLLSPRKTIRKEEDLPPYALQDRTADQWILRKTGGSRKVTCGFIRKSWRSILEGRARYEERKKFIGTYPDQVEELPDLEELHHQEDPNGTV